MKKKPKKISMSNQLRAIIRRSGVTGYRLSMETGINQSIISRFMRGNAMDSGSMDAIGAYLGLQIVVNTRLAKPKTKKLTKTKPRVSSGAGKEELFGRAKPVKITKRDTPSVADATEA